MSPRPYTSKQMGDACEMPVAAELTLAGVPAMKMPDNWPGYDVIAQLKSRTFQRGGDAYVEYKVIDNSFDWLAIVLLHNDNESPTKRQFFIFPKDISDVRFYRYGPKTKYHDFTILQVDRLASVLSEFEDNFILSKTGTARPN